MLKCGVSRKDAGITAKVLVTTDIWGIHTHGTKQLRNFSKCIRAGAVNSKAVSRSHLRRAGLGHCGWALCNADGLVMFSDGDGD